jgi:hypothetical protein
MIVRRGGHPRLADGYDGHADRAYETLTGPVEPQIEQMLATGGQW